MKYFFRRMLFGIIPLFAFSCRNEGKNEFNYFYQNGPLQISVARKEVGGPWRMLFVHKMDEQTQYPMDNKYKDTLRHSLLITTLRDKNGSPIIAKDTQAIKLENWHNENSNFQNEKSFLKNWSLRGEMDGFNNGREIRHAYFLKTLPGKRGWTEMKLKFEMHLYGFHFRSRPGGRKEISKVITEKPWISLEIPMYVKL